MVQQSRPFQYEPVDPLSGSDRDRDLAKDRAPATRRFIVVGVGLVALGVALGWLIASPEEPLDREADSSIAVPDLPSAERATTDVPEATVAPAFEPAPEPTTPTTRTRPLNATVKPLERIGELAGAITLVPGLEVSLVVRLHPDGTVVAASPEKTPVSREAERIPPAVGLPLADVADGVLFAPVAGSGLGAVAYWQLGIGGSWPLPDAPATTSYLAASGDFGIFLSEGDVVVRDMAQLVDVLRVDAQFNESPVTQACVNLDVTALALVTRTGQSVVLDMDTGAVMQEFVTDTTLRGVAWAGTNQLVYLAESPVAAEQVVRALDIVTGAVRDVAQLDRASIWKLSTTGPSC